MNAAAVILNTLRQMAPRSGRPLLVAIDGRCASGKTTLAGHLRQACGCAVVHMDDFFLRPEQRTRSRYATPGENVDHERFLEEVLLPLHRGETAQYASFDCRTLELGDPVRVEQTPVVLVEGSYSCHPNLRPYYDLKIFLTVDPEEQLRRITARNGEDAVRAFRDKWIPWEEAYFAAYDLERVCDLYFSKRDIS